MLHTAFHSSAVADNLTQTCLAIKVPQCHTGQQEYAQGAFTAGKTRFALHEPKSLGTEKDCHDHITTNITCTAALCMRA